MAIDLSTLLIVGAGLAAGVILLRRKGYLGTWFAGSSATSVPSSAAGLDLASLRSADLFRLGAQRALEEAHLELAERLATESRDRLIGTIKAPFEGSAPASQEAATDPKAGANGEASAGR